MKAEVSTKKTQLLMAEFSMSIEKASYIFAMSRWVASSGGVMLAQDGHEGSCEQPEIGTSTQERLAARERWMRSRPRECVDGWG